VWIGALLWCSQVPGAMTVGRLLLLIEAPGTYFAGLSTLSVVQNQRLKTWYLRLET
jgi:hypothetical protein